MHDLNCTSASDMDFKLMADRTRYLKEDPKGVREMFQIMEDMKKDTRTKALKEVALHMSKAKKYTLERVLKPIHVNCKPHFAAYLSRIRSA